MAGFIPNGQQQFFSGTGTPLAAGAIDFYVPGTTTRKDTWQDALGTILNTNPVMLNGAGRAIIFGNGSYRQVVKDAQGNTIWDQAVGSIATSIDSGTSYVTPEQFGATGTTAHNDQPAFQAAVNYCQANGIPEIRLGAKTYEIWQPVRTTDVAYGYQVTDGIALYITASLKISGVVGRTVLKCLNSLGGTHDTVTQNPSGGPWRGYAIVCNPATTVDGWTFENFELDGTKAFYYPGSYTNAQSDITHKGFSVNPTGVGDFKRLILRNIKAHNFGGEIFYLGGSATSVIEAYECEGYYSNQSAWNPTGLGRVSAYNIQMHDCYLASEIISGQGHRYYGGRFANCYNSGAIGTQSFATGYAYDFPNRDNTKAPTFVEYLDTVIENVGGFNFASWTRARIKMIDSGATCGAGGRDIYVDADVLIDQGTSTSPLVLNGPATLTTQIPSTPAGTYYAPMRNVQVKMRIRRTQRAVANSVTSITAIQIQPGLIDSTSVRIQVEGEVGHVMSMIGTPVTGQIQPLVTLGDLIPLFQPAGGGYDTPSSATNYTPDEIAHDLQPTAVGPVDLGMNNTYAGAPYVAADGQIHTFRHNGTNGNLARFKANGNLLGLTQDRILANKGDILQLKYSLAAGVWEEYYFSSSRQIKFVGTALITPASLATATQVTLGTVTATGAAVGDVVVGVAASVSAAGVRLWGDVTAVNTVTVYARNDSGVAWTPGATTFTARVEKV